MSESSDMDVALVSMNGDTDRRHDQQMMGLGQLGLPFMNFDAEEGGSEEEKVWPKKVIDVQKYKTKICKNWATSKHCTYGDRCVFAHGNVDQRRPAEAEGGRRRKGKKARDDDEVLTPMGSVASSKANIMQNTMGVTGGYPLVNPAMLDPMSMALLQQQAALQQQQQQVQPMWLVPVTTAGTTSF